MGKPSNFIIKIQNSQDVKDLNKFVELQRYAKYLCKAVIAHEKEQWGITLRDYEYAVIIKDRGDNRVSISLNLMESGIIKESLFYKEILFENLKKYKNYKEPWKYAYEQMLSYCYAVVVRVNALGYVPDKITIKYDRLSEFIDFLKIE